MNELQTFFDNEEVDPENGYEERDVVWFEQHILQDFRRRILPDDILLDVGCGYGYFTVRYAEYVEFAMGIDFSGVRIEKAAQVNAAKNVRYKQHDITQGPLHDDVFTVAVSSAVFQHIQPELRRVAFENVAKSLDGCGGTFLLYDEDFTVRPEKWNGWYEPLSLTWLCDNVGDLFTVTRTPEPIVIGNHKEAVFRYELIRV